MADLIETKQSEVIRITNGDESLVTDIVDVDGVKSLCVNATGSVSTTVDGSGLLIPTVKTAVNMTAGQIVTLVNKTGKGFLGGIKANFSYELGSIRVTIDGVVSFYLSAIDLRNFNFVAYSDTGLNRWFGAEQYGEFEFYPSQLIGYNASLKVEAINQAGFVITLNRSMVIHS